jgi:hypothetical protein
MLKELEEAEALRKKHLDELQKYKDCDPIALEQKGK